MKRIKKLQDHLKKENLDVLLVEDTFNILYLTGLEMSAGQVLISQNDATLFVDGRYIERAKKESPIPVKPIEELSYDGIKTLGFNSETLTYQKYEKLPNSATLVPCNNPIKNILRIVKDPDEIAILKKAGEHGSKGLDHLLTLIKEGVTEQQLQDAVSIFWLTHGIHKRSFDPIIAFGPHSAIPHHETSSRKLQKGDTILIDMGVIHKHYCSDMTRTLFFGEPPPEMKKVYNIVKEAQEKALALCKPGTQICDLDKTARDHIDSQGYGKQFVHRLGHGVGLDIHEAPNVREDTNFPLTPGMVITIEPGIYIPNLGGVRIENTVVITETGYDDFTNRSTEFTTIS